MEGVEWAVGCLLTVAMWKMSGGGRVVLEQQQHAWCLVDSGEKVRCLFVGAD